MKSIILGLVLAFTASFTFNSQEEKLEPVMDHHWNTDYNAFRSYQEFSNLRVFGMDNIPVENIEIDMEFIKEKLRVLSGEVTFKDGTGADVRIPERGSKLGRNLTHEFLKQEYEKLGYKVSFHTYQSGQNFIAERTGVVFNKFIVLTSHMDSVSNAGADDNGSGTIANLAIAKALAAFDIKYSIRIIAFDQEELGLVGSRYYVKDANKEEILFNWNQDMIGYDSDGDGAFHVMDCDRADSIPISTRAVYVLNQLALPLKVTKACTDRSDHASFWRHNLPAIITSENFFGKDANKCYHQQCDKMNIMNFGYMENITKLVASSLLTFLQGY